MRRNIETILIEKAEEALITMRGDDSLRVTQKGALTFAALGVGGRHVPVAVHALVTALTFDKSLADTSPGDKVVRGVSPTFTLAPMLRPNRVAVAT